MRSGLIFIFLVCVTALANADIQNHLTSAQLQQLQIATQKDLTEGKLNEARNRLEQVSSRYHSVEIELALVQTLMQAGEYRNALNAAAHVQAEHRDNPDSSIFYAWLLALSGQYKPAQDLLVDTYAQHPQLNTLPTLRQQLETRKLDINAFKSPNIELHPYSPPLINDELVQGAILLSGGQYLVTPVIHSADNKMFVVRNGLGKLYHAKKVSAFKDTQLMLLELTEAAPNISTPTLNGIRSGLPTHLIGYSPPSTIPSWPLLYTAIPGIANTDNQSASPLSFPIQSPPLIKGAGAYNPAGELIGITDNQNTQVIIPLTRLVEFLKLPTGAPDKNSALTGARSPADIYEAALANSAQILVEDR